MGFGVELKESKLEMDDDSVKKEIGELPKEIEEKSMPCTSNFEDHSFYNVEDLTEDNCVGGDASSNKDVDEEDDEVDILEGIGFNNDNNEIEVSECNDGTDVYSSSFSGTVSEHESETAFNDQEADSMIYPDAAPLPFWVRKKKLTDHWRRFIQPIMWRCKWVELKIKELQNQAQMYDKELQESCQAKQLESENLKPEELGIKESSPLPCHTQKTLLKKRKKRKQAEEASDVLSYQSNHNLFSYHEYRKSFAGTALNDNSRNLDKKNKNSKEDAVFCEETLPLEFREGDAYLEQILLQIEAAKLEARNLKIRVDKVVNETQSRFSSDTLNMLGSADVFIGSEQQKPQLVIKNEDEKEVISEEKPVKAASVSSHHDAQPEDDGTADILLSEIVASRRREGKAIVPDKKLQKTEQTSVEEGPSRPVRKRRPRNLDVVVKEETNRKKDRVSREKPKSNVTMASRFKLPNRKRNRGKRRPGSAGLRRRS